MEFCRRESKFASRIQKWSSIPKRQREDETPICDPQKYLGEIATHRIKPTEFQTRWAQEGQQQIFQGAGSKDKLLYHKPNNVPNISNRPKTGSTLPPCCLATEHWQIAFEANKTARRNSRVDLQESELPKETDLPAGTDLFRTVEHVAELVPPPNI